MRAFRRLERFDIALILLTLLAYPCLGQVQQPGLELPSYTDIPCSFVNGATGISNLFASKPLARPTAKAVTGSTSLTPTEKLECLLRVSYSADSFIWPGVAASKKMIFPPQAYPSEWRQGFWAFTRNYGDALANDTANRGAKYLSAVVLREDTRYWTSTDKNFFPRVFHLITFAFINKSDTGRNTPAISNFIGAAAGGFIGNAYLPQGYANVTHAGQRSLIQLGESPLPNVACEFTPEFRTFLKRIHLAALNGPLFSKCAR